MQLSVGACTQHVHAPRFNLQYHKEQIDRQTDRHAHVHTHTYTVNESRFVHKCTYTHVCRPPTFPTMTFSYLQPYVPASVPSLSHISERTQLHLVSGPFIQPRACLLLKEKLVCLSLHSKQQLMKCEKEPSELILLQFMLSLSHPNKISLPFVF